MIAINNDWEPQVTCDVCQKSITNLGHGKGGGIAIWRADKPEDFLFVHKMRCDPRCTNSRRRHEYSCWMPLGEFLERLTHSLVEK
jgi:hypothetical protein